MKTTLLLCTLLALTGCNSDQTSNDKKDQEAKKNPVANGDSPIIVSDSSTHLKHKGSAQDFQIGNSGTALVATVSDAGYTVRSLDCVGFTGCSSVNLTKGWTLVASDASGIMIFTMTSADNITITTTFNATISQLDSTIDTTGDTPTGTELIHEGHTLRQATLNGTTWSCPSTPCKVKIHYSNK